MSDKQLEQIIKNQELQIALLTKLLESQPKQPRIETAKLKDYRNEYNTGR